MQSSSTFIKISENIPEVRRYVLINYWENIIAHGKNPSKGSCKNVQVWFVPDTVVRSVQHQDKLWGRRNTRKILQFLLSLNGNSTSST